MLDRIVTTSDSRVGGWEPDRCALEAVCCWSCVLLELCALEAARYSSFVPMEVCAVEAVLIGGAQSDCRVVCT